MKLKPSPFPFGQFCFWVCLALGFAFSSAAVYLLGQGVATRNASPAPRSTPSGRSFLAKFTDVAAQAGLSMRFTVGSETTKKYILEANGTGVALVDFDNDGKLDIFLVNGSRLEGYQGVEPPTNRLYRSSGSEKFIDMTKKAGMARSGWGSGVCAGDVDNDGREDVYVTYWGPNAFYRNRGDFTFEDVSAQSGVSGLPKAVELRVYVS